MALGVVALLLYASLTGVYYVQVMSSGSYDAAVARAREINEALEQSGETSLHAKAHHPRGQNPFCAIFVGGPHLSESAAEETLKRLQSNRDLLDRDRDLARHLGSDAMVKAYTLRQALPF